MRYRHKRAGRAPQIFSPPYSADIKDPDSIHRALDILRGEGRFEEYETDLLRSWRLLTNYWSTISPSSFLEEKHENATLFAETILERSDIHPKLRNQGRKLKNALLDWQEKNERFKEKRAVLDSLVQRIYASKGGYGELEELSVELESLEKNPLYKPYKTMLVNAREILNDKYSLYARARRKFKNWRQRKASVEPTVEGFLLILRGSATQYDVRRSAKDPYHNKYALSHYMEAISRIESGFTPEELKSSDPTLLSKLAKDIAWYLRIPGIVNKVIKQIDLYITQGKMPRYPVTSLARRRKKEQSHV